MYILYYIIIIINNYNDDGVHIILTIDFYKCFIIFVI